MSKLGDGDVHGVFSRAISLVDSLLWSTANPVSTHSGDKLSIYLGPHWLSDTHIEQLGDILSSQIDSDNIHVLHPLVFLKLESLYRVRRDTYKTTKDASYSHSLGDNLSTSSTVWIGGVINIKVGEADKVSLPGPYESGNHWAAFAFSGATGILAYGDSFQEVFPTELRELLEWWINEHLLERVEIRIEQMECTRQQDGYSCRVLAFNALCHHLLPQEYPLIDAAYTDEARVELFMKVVDNLQSDPWMTVSGE